MSATTATRRPAPTPLLKRMVIGHPLVALFVIEDDSSLTPVSQHEDIAAAGATGKHRVEVEDLDFGHGLYADGLKVASFAEGRVGYREWARRSGMLADIHSIDDRLDHDVDELMA